MKYSKHINLKDGEECWLRSAGEQDAVQILEHLIITSGETSNLARYPDEIHMSVEQEKDFLKKVELNPGSAMIAAFINGKVAGTIGLSPVNLLEKYRHRAEIGLSVKSLYWGRGIGSALLESAMETARTAGYERLELEVMADNTTALALYERFGFEPYGIREDSFRFRDGKSASAYLMARKLS